MHNFFNAEDGLLVQNAWTWYCCRGAVFFPEIFVLVYIVTQIVESIATFYITKAGVLYSGFDEQLNFLVELVVITIILKFWKAVVSIHLLDFFVAATFYHNATARNEVTWSSDNIKSVIKDFFGGYRCSYLTAFWLIWNILAKLPNKYKMKWCRVFESTCRLYLSFRCALWDEGFVR